MLSEAQIRSVCLFYFFVLLDESEALTWTLKTIGKFSKAKTGNQGQEVEWASEMVYLTHESWRQLQKKGYGLGSPVSYEAGFLVPSDVDLGIWKQFRKEAESDEFLAVIWSKILGVSDADMAKGLAITLGTVRHRVGRGLRHLGSLKYLG